MNSPNPLTRADWVAIAVIALCALVVWLVR
jgi:hypothetical protein